MEDILSKYVKSRNFVVKVRLDTSGRKGKGVTVLDGWPKIEPLLVDLAKVFKNTCGAGGTYLMSGKDGVIEIQGDHRDRICGFLEKQGIKTKRS